MGNAGFTNSSQYFDNTQKSLISGHLWVAQDSDRNYQFPDIDNVADYYGAGNVADKGKNEYYFNTNETGNVPDFEFARTTYRIDENTETTFFSRKAPSPIEYTDLFFIAEGIFTSEAVPV